MIEILGVNSGKEFEAAVHIRKQILAVWRDLSQSRDDHIKLGAVPDVQLREYGLSHFRIGKSLAR